MAMYYVFHPLFIFHGNRKQIAELLIETYYQLANAVSLQ